MDAKRLVEMITPIDVAKRYLGNPYKASCSNLVYKSPFRNERTASFVVSNIKGFHDFGDGWHGGIIDFAKRYFNISFKEAVNMLATEFGICIENEYITNDVWKMLKKQREEEKRYKEAIESWYNKIYCELCDRYHSWLDIKNIFKAKPYLYTYKAALDKSLNCEYLIEVFIDNCKEKETLYKEREAVECFMKAIQ